MAYFVQADNGQQYGPVELDGLRQWAAEGRLASHTVLVDAVTGERIQAGSIAGLFGAVPPPMFAQPQVAPKKSNAGLIIGIIALVGCCAIVPIFAAILFPVFAQAKLAAKRTAEMSHAKQLATSALIYTNDFDDHFPPEFEKNADLHLALELYAKDPAAFVITNPDGGEFRGNGALAGMDSKQIKSPLEVPMLYDNMPWQDNTMIAAFADGHVKAKVPRDWLEQVLKADVSTNPPEPDAAGKPQDPPGNLDTPMPQN